MAWERSAATNGSSALLIKALWLGYLAVAETMTEIMAVDLGEQHAPIQVETEASHHRRFFGTGVGLRFKNVYY
jgi:hypothetical protein